MGLAAWYVIRTEPQGEQRAYKWLTYSTVHNQRGTIHRVYYPTERRVIKHGPGRGNQKNRTVMRPMCPGYLFALLDSVETDWEKIRSAPGVYDFLKPDGENKATISEAAIEVLKMVEDELSQPKNKRKIWPFNEGSKVQIGEGPFAGYEAVLQRLDKKDRTVLELVSPGRQVVRDVPAQWLKAV